jgi:hypothetical protein
MKLHLNKLAKARRVVVANGSSIPETYFGWKVGNDTDAARAGEKKVGKNLLNANEMQRTTASTCSPFEDRIGL